MSSHTLDITCGGKMHAGRKISGLAAAIMLSATAAQAQLIDFFTTNGGFTNQNLVGTNPWSWAAGSGWRVNGVATVARTRLLSPVLTATGGAFGVAAQHRFNFEQSIFSPTCFDGGAIFASINGGAFAQVTTGITGVGYTSTVSTNFSNPLGGLSAFCGQSAGWATPSFIGTTISGSLAAGTTVQLAFDGGWDDSFNETNPNWNLRSVELRGFGPAVVIPEPSTYALLATGLVALAFAARRRRV